VLGAIGALVSALTTTSCTDKNSLFQANCYSSKNTIKRDVVVIGGGSSGTYGAITLKDIGKSVVVVEKAPQLGGHINTYTEPASGTKIDYGVQVFWNTSVVTEFFARFNVAVAKLSRSPSTIVHADFKTGEVLQNFTSNTNLSTYTAQVNKYKYLELGWDLPSPVPTDLLLPFGDFLKKYSLQDEAYSIYINSATGGLGSILQQTTATVFKSLNQIVFDEGAGAAVSSANHNNHELWEKAQVELGSSVLLSSTVVAAQRSKSGVKLIVKTPAGNKLVQAKKLLVSAPLTKKNTAPFDLDAREQRIFGQFVNTAFYCGLVNSTGLPAGFNYLNTGANTLYNIPTGPGVYHVSPTTVQSIFGFWYGSDATVPEPTVKEEVRAAIAKLGGSAKPEFLAYANHTPYNLNVKAEAVRDGFYAELNGLQGYRSTWYTGGQFVPASGPLWVFTNRLVKDIAGAA